MEISGVSAALRRNRRLLMSKSEVVLCKPAPVAMGFDDGALRSNFLGRDLHIQPFQRD